MAFRGVLVKTDTNSIGINGILEVANSVIGITQVVNCRLMHRINRDGLRVVVYGIDEVLFIAIRVTKIVVSFYFLWV